MSLLANSMFLLVRTQEESFLWLEDKLLGNNYNWFLLRHYAAIALGTIVRAMLALYYRG